MRTNWEQDDWDAPADEPQDYPTDYCDFCEREGHTFSHCPARDDSFGDDT